ncbi:MAG TPA: hypothetical protein VHX65_19845 [Pirellulales bacterium]|nr:hypothetical protein [Pirellulales bacterium]
MAQVVGEPVDDVRAYALACRECGITPEIEATHVAAARSFDRWRDWPAEREAALERRNAAEAHWQQAETAADLALTQARKKRRAAQSEIARLLRDSDRPYRFATVNSPFLFASLAEAAKVAGQPSLTFEELSSLQENRYPDFAVAQARAQKLAEIKAAQ